mgnify:FL=1
MQGLRLTVVLWLLSVVVISLPLLGLARLVAPWQAEGSLIARHGVVIGSRLIGQRFRSDAYLQGRPAGGANLAPGDPDLVARVAAAQAHWQALGITRPAADLLLDSASGVDPHITPSAPPRQQLPRLARRRAVPLDRLEALLRQSLERPRGLRTVTPLVNVLAFNLALDALALLSDPAGPAREPPVE